MQTGNGIFWLEVGGTLGAFLSGPVSDYVFGGRRLPLVWAPMLVPALVVAALDPAASAGAGTWAIVLLYSLMFTLGFALYMPTTINGLIVVEVTDPRVLGTANGVIGFLSYFGAALGGSPLQTAVATYGWSTGFYTTLAGVAALASVLALSATLCGPPSGGAASATSAVNNAGTAKAKVD